MWAGCPAYDAVYRAEWCNRMCVQGMANLASSRNDWQGDRFDPSAIIVHVGKSAKLNVALLGQMT